MLHDASAAAPAATTAQLVDRRAFLRRLGAASALVGASGLLAACGQAPAAPAGGAATAAPAAKTGASPAATSAPAQPATGAKPGAKYPTRPVDFIVPFAPGGGADQLARQVAPNLEKQLGVAFPVLNVAGASGGTGMAKLMAAPADGQSIIVYIADTNALVAGGSATWKMSDLAPIARMMKVPSFLFVANDSPYKTFDDLEKAVKDKNGAMKAAILGKGSVDEVTLSYMASKGFKTTMVPLTNTGERFTSVLGGAADMVYEQAGDVAQLLTSKQIRPILIFNETRLPEFPDVVSSKEKGYDIFLPQFRGIVAKAGTPDSAVQALSNAFKVAYDSPEVREFAKIQYMTDDSYMPAAEFKAFLENETKTMDKFMTEFKLK